MAYPKRLHIKWYPLLEIVQDDRDAYQGILYLRHERSQPLKIRGLEQNKGWRMREVRRLQGLQSGSTGAILWDATLPTFLSFLPLLLTPLFF